MKKFNLLCFCLILFLSCNKKDKNTLLEETQKENTLDLERIRVDLYTSYSEIEKNGFNKPIHMVFIGFDFQLKIEQDCENFNFQKPENRKRIQVIMKTENESYNMRTIGMTNSNELIIGLKAFKLKDFNKSTENITSVDDLVIWMLKLNFELEINPGCIFEYQKPTKTTFSFIFSDNYSILYEMDANSRKIYKEVSSEKYRVISSEYINYK